MCQFCDKVRIKQCKIVVEEQEGIRNMLNGKLELQPCFAEISVPLNYCPYCGRKLEKCK